MGKAINLTENFIAVNKRLIVLKEKARTLDEKNDEYKKLKSYQFIKKSKTMQEINLINAETTVLLCEEIEDIATLMKLQGEMYNKLHKMVWLNAGEIKFALEKLTEFKETTKHNVDSEQSLGLVDSLIDQLQAKKNSFAGKIAEVMQKDVKEVFKKDKTEE